MRCAQRALTFTTDGRRDCARWVCAGILPIQVTCATSASSISTKVGGFHTYVSQYARWCAARCVPPHRTRTRARCVCFLIVPHWCSTGLRSAPEWITASPCFPIDIVLVAVRRLQVLHDGHAGPRRSKQGCRRRWRCEWWCSCAALGVGVLSRQIVSGRVCASCVDVGGDLGRGRCVDCMLRAMVCGVSHMAAVQAIVIARRVLPHSRAGRCTRASKLPFQLRGAGSRARLREL